MKSKSLILFLLFYSCIIFSQKAVIQSFEHSVRWVNEQKIPNYISTKSVQDTILSVTVEALKRKLNVKQVIFPNEIIYNYYEGFGKPKIKMSKNSRSLGDFELAILSFITRDTYNLKIYWNTEIVILQNGKTYFSNKKTHELDFFETSYINLESGQFSEAEFTRIFASLIEELLDESKNVSNIINIGLDNSIDNAIEISIPNRSKLKMITNGSFLSDADFSVSIEKEQNIISKVVYHNGKNSSKGKGNFGGWLFANVETTVLGNGTSSSYMKKTHEIRNGKLEFSTGEVHELKMEWEQNTEKVVVNDADNDGIIATRTGYSEQLSPMKIDIIKKDSLYGNLTYFKEGELFAVEGQINNHLINVFYSPSTKLLRIIENNETIVIVEMHNVNPENKNSFAGNKITNKKLFSSNKSKLPEWYNVYVEPNINTADTSNYMEAVFCLFFGMGNHT